MGAYLEATIVDAIESAEKKLPAKKVHPREHQVYLHHLRLSRYYECANIPKYYDV